jgi:V/A-type H+-transporting ATPase subunit I
MITAMKKYAFLVFHQDYEKFLSDIRELGVLHVIEKQQGEFEDETLSTNYKLIAEIKSVQKYLEKYSGDEFNSVSDTTKGAEILEEVKGLQHDIEYYEQQIALIQKELLKAEPWGEYSLKGIQNLQEKGVALSFYACADKRFKEEWNNQYSIHTINTIGTTLYFVVVHKPNETVELDAELQILPEKSLNELRKEKESFEQHIVLAEDKLKEIATQHTNTLNATLRKLHSKVDLRKVELNTEDVAESKVKLVEGWVPDDKASDIENYLETASVYFEKYKPTEEDSVPIKLKNKKFSKLYEPIGELYTMPNYKELDLTPFFAPFYMLFFGFCLGDAGYGLLITLGTIYGMFKASDKVKPLLKLGMFLGIATTLMGIVGGTFFGIMLHPDDYKSAYVLPQWIQQYQGYILSSDNLMTIALGIGYLQVLVGMFINAANRIRIYGFKYAVSQLGWSIIVLVTIPAYASYAFFNLVPPTIGSKVALVSGIIGGIPAIFYNSPGKNPLLNLGTGLWDSYQMASGLLGDVLSYIRLFALGLSSAILGNVFNMLAFDLSPEIPVLRQFVMILILAFGHGLNFFMAVLGSFVHPLRLTFVEFYKNAGFMGGGKKYEPFTK